MTTTTAAAAAPAPSRAGLWAIAASALLAILGDVLDVPLLLWIFKPLTTVLIIAWAWRRGPSPLRAALLAGLVLSLGGDVALLWPAQGFVPGLVCFLLAHLAYIVAFTRDARLAGRPVPFAAYALVAGAILAVLWPGVPVPLRAPVLVYVVCLAGMAAQAASRALQRAGEPGTRIAAIGGALFVASDGLIAVDRFHTPLPHGLVAILLLYWMAQVCIAMALPARGAR
jgi:uncharacterized membrane protein YhhN